MDFTARFLDWLAGLPAGWLYLAAAAVLATEVGLLAGLVMPAASTMLTVGFLAYAGRLDLTTALVVLTAAALVGDHVGYLEGRLVGPRLRRGWLGRRVGDRRWDRAEALVAARGGRAVLLGRWVAFVRTLVPRVAAVAGVPYRRFALFNAAGVLVWVPGTVLAGYLAGASYSRLTGLAGVAGAVLAGGAGLAGVAMWWRRRRARAAASRGGPCAGPVRPRRSPLRSRSWRGRPARNRRPHPAGRARHREPADR
ncbi:DedA family protein [Micromonospora sp. NPDC049559]|uniref:DedA family protein n=1 Tax=Micromonospora sp. NPDC049559 TaxID=3155923 RepID=UPI0034297F3F